VCNNGGSVETQRGFCEGDTLFIGLIREFVFGIMQILVDAKDLLWVNFIYSHTSGYRPARLYAAPNGEG
jgi:hypothetical protein